MSLKHWPTKCIYKTLSYFLKLIISYIYLFLFVFSLGVLFENKFNNIIISLKPHFIWRRTSWNCYSQLENRISSERYNPSYHFLKSIAHMTMPTVPYQMSWLRF